MKTINKIIIGLVLVVVLLCVVTFTLEKTTIVSMLYPYRFWIKKTAIESSAVTIPTDWKRYRNEEYQVEFSYPSSWQLELFENPNTNTLIIIKSDIKSSFAPSQLINPPEDSYVKYQISIGLYSKEDFYKVYSHDPSYEKRIIVDGRNALQNMPIANSLGDCVTLIDYSITDYISFSLYPCSSTEKTGSEAEIMKVYEQLLTSIKFAASTQNSCKDAGGKWEDGINVCNLPTKDAGTVCSEQDNCEGACIAILSKTDEDKVLKHEDVYTTGMCSEYKYNYGCFPFVEDGKVDKITCIDL